MAESSASTWYDDPIPDFSTRVFDRPIDSNALDSCLELLVSHAPEQTNRTKKGCSGKCIDGVWNRRNVVHPRYLKYSAMDGMYIETEGLYAPHID